VDSIDKSPNILPAISVILPVYNGGSYLRLSVESVLKQSLQNFEFLIIDDQSSDGSWEYLQSINDKRIVLARNDSNKGLFYNLNFLVRKCKSGLIKLWAQDDIMYDHCLQSFCDFHRRYPKIGFSYSDRDIIDSEGNIVPNSNVDFTPPIISTALHAKIAFYTGSIAGNIANVCISKHAITKVGLFNESMKISADFDMWVRLAKEHDTGFINQKLIQLRDHRGQLSRNEKFYINHVKEDLIVYRNLFSYVDPKLKKDGRSLMRSHKLVFYYTLMIKSLLRGELKNTIEYARTLSSFDNLVVLSLTFIKAKLRKPNLPNLFD
jgi:glycosyltransferase involved in cell wall biosynthesis